MSISDGLLICATIIGPIAAVQAQKWIERYGDARSQKVAIFSTLMTSRATPLVQERIRALNSIDIVFRKDKPVIDAWRELHDSFNTPGDNGFEKAVELLFQMSKNLGYGFDRIMIKRVIYLPQGHVDEANAQADLRNTTIEMMKGQRSIQQSMLDYLSGKTALRVTIVDDAGAQEASTK